MKIAISGSSGLVGRHLTKHFTETGHEVIPIPRPALYGPPETLAQLLAGTGVMIHLAGAPLFSRWTKAGRRLILESRVIPTQNLVKAVALMPVKPGLFISTSAVGIYSEKPQQTEAAAVYAADFPAEVCKQWEDATEGISEQCRLVIFRLGIVLDAKDGALKRMLPAFRLGVGGPIASGRQMFSWIHIRDIIGAVQFSIDHPLSGTCNLCAPEAISNLAFSKQLARVLSRPCWLRIPAFVLKVFFGNAATVLINGQDVIPEKLLHAGFVFRFPRVSKALEDLFL